MALPKEYTSILDSVKASLGIVQEYTAFDPQLIMFINSVFPTLYQLGVGHEDGFAIDDRTTEWSDYLEDNKLLNFVKSYMYIKVRLLFDPPTATALNAMEKIAQEYEWRILAMVEPTKRGASPNG